MHVYPHNFYDRENFVKDLISVAVSNYQARGDPSQQKHTMVLIPGGPGIGKSRAGWESQRLVFHADKFKINIDDITEGQSSNSEVIFTKDEIEPFLDALRNPCYISIDFSNECSYDWHLDEKYDASVRIGIRIAIASGLVKNLAELLDNYPLKEFTANNVMQKILEHRFQASKRTLEAIIIHMDEYQIYIDSLQKHGNREWSLARDLFKDMLKQIGGFMRKDVLNDPEKQYFVIPICTGTSAIDVHFLPTEYRHEMVAIKPLDLDAARHMFLDKFLYSKQTDNIAKARVLQDLQRHYSSSYNDNLTEDKVIELSSALCDLIWEQDHFKIALNDSGFIPRFIDFFLRYDALKTNNNWGQNLYREVVHRYGSTNFENEPGYWSSSHDIRAIISFGITGQLVTREFLLPSGRSIGDIERDGLLYLSRVKNNCGHFFIVMPFMLMKALNEMLIQKKIVRLETQLANEQRENWRLSDVFRGAQGDATLLQHEVKLRKLNVFTEKERFLVKTTSTASYNKSILCDDGVTRDLSEGVYRCAINNANVDHRWTINSVSGKPLAIFMQDRHSALETENPIVYYNDLNEWYKRTLRSVRKYNDYYDVVLVFFTNRPYVEDLPKLSNMGRLLLIDKSCIKKYLSQTFAHRG
ncbi:hypothetical protein BC937DRAFT_93803, partial [Endogone sp. FLAS-F59071]